MAGSAANATSQKTQPESVWLASLDGGWPPRRMFELPTANTPATSVEAAAEHIVDLVLTPDASRLVAITREAGPPVRARIFLLHVLLADEGQSSADELVLLPADVLPDTAVPDPSGRWLALVTFAAVAPGGNNLLNLCALELRARGTFRDVVDLGPGAAAPAAATSCLAARGC